MSAFAAFNLMEQVKLVPILELNTPGQEPEKLEDSPGDDQAVAVPSTSCIEMGAKRSETMCEKYKVVAALFLSYKYRDGGGQELSLVNEVQPNQANILPSYYRGFKKKVHIPKCSFVWLQTK